MQRIEAVCKKTETLSMAAMIWKKVDEELNLCFRDLQEVRLSEYSVHFQNFNLWKVQSYELSYITRVNQWCIAIAHMQPGDYHWIFIIWVTLSYPARRFLGLRSCGSQKQAYYNKAIMFPLQFLLVVSVICSCKLMFCPGLLQTDMIWDHPT